MGFQLGRLASQFKIPVSCDLEVVGEESEINVGSFARNENDLTFVFVGAVSASRAEAQADACAAILENV